MSSERAANMSSSESYTLAGPSNTRPSLPVIFATQPSGARLPYRICNSKHDPSAGTGTYGRNSRPPNLAPYQGINCVQCIMPIYYLEEQLNNSTEIALYVSQTLC